MADSFLVKFLSSMFRQVGKDTGKVISNLVYKDAHATPIRHVSSKGGTSSTIKKPLTAHERAMAEIQERRELTRSILEKLK